MACTAAPPAALSPSRLRFGVLPAATSATVELDNGPQARAVVQPSATAWSTRI